MRYRVSHTTEYFYGEPVPLSHNLVHLRPRDTERQNCVSTDLQIEPFPSIRRERVDFFGNYTTWFSVEEPHEKLRVRTLSEVEVLPFEPALGLAGIFWESVPEALRARRDPPTLDARQFTFESTYVPLSQELSDYARPSFTAGRPLFDAVVELTHRIHRDFTFETGVTTVGTPVHDVLRHRRGVCQDFAHLEIGCLRSLGLAARYVSGYLLTYPAPGSAPLTGGDASHAWLAVYFPDFGWVDLDPTNGVIPSSEHITLGWARDYEDISPMKGVIVGARRHDLDVSVMVTPLPSAGEQARDDG